MGGLIGVVTTVCNNLAFGHISISAIVGLGLTGQAVTSLVIDQFGLMGMPRCAFRPARLCGVLCMAAGVTYMLLGTAFVWWPVLLSLVSGVSVVTSRTVNARLAETTSVWVSTWYNYAIGLVGAAAVLLALGRAELGASLSPAFAMWMLGGGVLGALVVLLSNVTVARISAFHMTLLLFVAQVFTGIALDMLTTRQFSQANLVGGALVAAGMCLNLWLEQRCAPEKAGNR